MRMLGSQRGAVNIQAYLYKKVYCFKEYLT